MTNYRFIRRLNDGSTYHLGTAVQSGQGWRFIPNVVSHRSSRKFHPTMTKCLPRWIGYPDRCESVAVGEIVTNNIYPPIPDRRFDWSAVTDNYEPDCPIGYGRTEQEAIDDLLKQMDDAS